MTKFIVNVNELEFWYSLKNLYFLIITTNFITDSESATIIINFVKIVKFKIKSDSSLLLKLSLIMGLKIREHWVNVNIKVTLLKMNNGGSATRLSIDFVLTYASGKAWFALCSLLLGMCTVLLFDVYV